MMTETTEPGGSPVEGQRRSTYLRLWIMSGGILFLDQVSKWLVADVSGWPMGLYPPFGGKEIIPGFLNIVYSINYGAAWGMLEGYAWLLICLAVLVLALIAIFRKDLALHTSVSQWCFGLIIGGIVGNTIDRVLRGHVVDFLDVRLPGYQWPTFNVADSAIVIGTFWYIYLQFRPPKA